MFHASFFGSFARRFLTVCTALTIASAALPAQTPSSADGFNPQVDGNVYAVAVQADGKSLIGGQFTSVQPGGSFEGVPRNNIARLNADGSVDAAFNPDANGAIRALVLEPDGQILIGGDFTSVGGVVRHRVARLNPDGSLDTGFDPNVTGALLPQVHALAVQPDGAVVVGGFFTEVQPAGAAGTTPRRNLARFTSSGALDTAWNPSPNGIVLALAPHVNNTVLVGGGFTSFQPNGASTATARNRIARLNADGSLDAGFDPNANNAVEAFAVQQDGKIYIGGAFTLLKDVERSRFARLNVDGSLDTTFASGVSGTVRAIGIHRDGGILVGGAFATVWSGNSAVYGRTHLARFFDDGDVDGLFNISFNAEVSALAFQADGKIVVGGYFTRINPTGVITGQVRNHVARITANGTLDASFALDPGGRPLVSAVQEDGKILIGGTFTNVGGKTRTSLARLHPDGSLDESFPHVDLNGPIFAILPLSGGDFVIGGNFTRAGGASHIRIARVKADGTVDASFKTVVGGAITALARHTGDTILVGGTFSTVQGTDEEQASSKSNLVRLTAAGKVDTAFSPVANGIVTAIVVGPDGRIVIGGDFSVVATTEGQWSRNKLARLNADGSMDADYDPAASHQVNALALQSDGKLVVGGIFNQAFAHGATEVVTRNRLMRLNPDGTLDTAFDPNLNNTVLTLAVQPGDQRILVGGTFTDALPAGDTEPTERHYLLRLTPEGALDPTFNLRMERASGNRVDSLTVASDGSILVGGSFSSVQPDPAAPRLARANFIRVTSGGAVDASFELGATTGEAGGQINALVFQTDGRVVAGGEFSDLGGAANNDLARFNPEGTVDLSFSPAVNAEGAVRAVAVRTNSAAITGQIGGFAWLNPDGTLRAGFTPAPGVRINGTINVAVLDPQGRVLLGGAFGAPAEGAFPNLVRFNPDGTLDTTFKALVNSSVTRIIVEPEGKIVIVGNFNAVNGQTRNFIARVDTNGALDADFEPNPDGFISAITRQPDGKYLIGGQFAFLAPNDTASVLRNFAARIEASGAVDTTFNPNPNGRVLSFSVDGDGKILMGGEFTQVQPGATGTAVTRTGFARFNPDGTLDQDFAPNPDGPVYASIVQADGSIVVAGDFLALGATSTTPTPRRYLARLTSTGTLDQSFNPNPNGLVHWLVRESGGSYLIVGSFTALQPGGEGPVILRDGLARITSTGAIDPGFNPDFAGRVTSVSLDAGGGVLVSGAFSGIQPNGLMVVGGAFTEIGGIGAERLALLADDGSVNGTFQPEPNAPVNAVLALPDGGFIVGGEFTSIAGATRTYLARFGPDNGLDATFVPSLPGPVAALARQPDGKILVSMSSHAPVRLNADGSNDASFDGSIASLGSRAVAVQADGKIVLLVNAATVHDSVVRLNPDGSRDGSFTGYGNSPGAIKTLVVQADGGVIVSLGANADGVVRLLPNGTVDTSFTHTVNGDVTAVAAQADGRVMIGGNFTRVDDQIRIRLARLPSPGSVTDTLEVTADRTTILWRRSGPTLELASAAFEFSADTITWTPLGQGTRVAGTSDWQLTGQALPATGLFYIRARGVAPSSGGTSSGLHEISRQFAYSNPLGDSGIVASLPPGSSGVFFPAGSSGQPTIRGVSSTAKLIGDASLVGEDIVHANGNIYDQILLQGAATTITADPGEVVRVSFRDLTNDIVQVEFSGAGSLSLVMANASAPSPADNYNQPGVAYVRGHAGIIIVGADETTNVSVFSVGPLTAVNPTLFRDDVTYDGVADLAFLAIASTDGKFGAIRTGNVNFYATSGLTGIYAPGVHFSGPVNLGDINGFDAAVAMLVIGSAPETNIAGGDLWQQNGQPVAVSGIEPLNFVAGMTSHGHLLPAQSNRAPLEQYEPAAAAPGQ